MDRGTEATLSTYNTRVRLVVCKRLGYSQSMNIAGSCSALLPSRHVEPGEMVPFANLLTRDQKCNQKYRHVSWASAILRLCHVEPGDLVPFANLLTRDKSKWMVAHMPLSELTTLGIV